MKILWTGTYHVNDTKSRPCYLIIVAGVIYQTFVPYDTRRYPLKEFIAEKRNGRVTGPPLSEEVQELVKLQLALEELKR